MQIPLLIEILYLVNIALLAVYGLNVLLLAVLRLSPWVSLSGC